MNLAGFALKYKAIVVTAVVLLMFWGFMSYFTMPRREDPEYVVRTCQVLTDWRGTPPVKVEELVTTWNSLQSKCKDDVERLACDLLLRGSFHVLGWQDALSQAEARIGTNPMTEELLGKKGLEDFEESIEQARSFRW